MKTTSILLDTVKDLPPEPAKSVVLKLVDGKEKNVDLRRKK